MSKIDTIMLFAAGRGTRMAHLTGDTPKPLLQIAGKPILYFALELCKIYKFKKIVINTHYFPEKIESFLREYKAVNVALPQIVTVFEQELLETGGAIKNSKEILGDNPIFTLNTDTILQVKYNVFNDMINFWDPKKMDFLLLLQPSNRAIGYCGKGDFELEKDARISRSPTQDIYSYMYAGLSIIKPNVVAQNTLNVFSLLNYYFNNDRVFGISAKDAKWYHASRPEDLLSIEADINSF